VFVSCIAVWQTGYSAIIALVLVQFWFGTYPYTWGPSGSGLCWFTKAVLVRGVGHGKCS
jgi:hypothetical protein